MDQETDNRLRAIEQQLGEIRLALLGSLTEGGGILVEHRIIRSQIERIQKETDDRRQAVTDFRKLEHNFAAFQEEFKMMQKIIDDLTGIRRSIVAWCAGASFAVMTCWTIIQAFFFK